MNHCFDLVKGYNLKKPGAMHGIVVTKTVTTPTSFHIIPAKWKGLKPAKNGGFQQVTAPIYGSGDQRSIRWATERILKTKDL